MIKYAKSLLSVAVLGALCTSAQAFIVPQTDFKKFEIMMTDDVNRSIEYVKTTGLYHAIDEARAFDTQSRVDAFNNGAANWVARVNQSAADVFMLNQKEKSMPSQDACQTVSVQGGLADAVCGEGGIADAVGEKMGMTDSGPLEIYNKAKTIVGSLIPKVIGADAPGSGLSTPAAGETESQKAYKKFVADEIAAVEKNMAWVAAGKGDKANSPTLLLVTSDMAPAYTPEELEMALNMARLTYPPFVRKYSEDPVNDREVAQDMRKKLRIELANSDIARQIGMRTSLDPTKPSKLMALGMPVALKFDDNNEIATDGQSWIHKVALNNNTTPTEMSKESLLMTGLKFNQALERYKSQLVQEQLLLNLYLVRLEKPARGA
jgi:hypothetical protein